MPTVIIGDARGNEPPFGEGSIAIFDDLRSAKENAIAAIRRGENVLRIEGAADVILMTRAELDQEVGNNRKPSRDERDVRTGQGSMVDRHARSSITTL